METLQTESAMNSLKLVVNSRLHLTLLALHNSEYRINGGLGFAINDPSCELKFSKSSNFSIQDNRDHPSNSQEIDCLLSQLFIEQNRLGFDYALDIEINGKMRAHAGFGSGTAVILACLEALHVLNGLETTPEELIAISGRGGTSGVGVHSYFCGGYVFDLGRKIDGGAIMPSNQTGPKPTPLLVDQGPMPDWEIGICFPSYMPYKSQSEERAFFARICPLTADAVYETVYHTLFGLYASIRESDKLGFCNALKKIQTCAWKQAERKEYGNELREIEQNLYAMGADAVGMSSLGPSLFFLANDLNDIVKKMSIARPDCEWFISRPDNNGRKIMHD